MMFIEDTYTDDRGVSCDTCGFDGEVSIPLVSYGTVEIGEWDCPQCNGYHEYRNDTIWDRVDEYRDMMKEGW
jgi:transcription elongation factor Elf1